MSSIFVRDGLCWLWQTVIRELHFLASIRLRLLRIALVDTWYLSATLGYWTADKNKLKRRSGRELVLVVISKYDKLPREQFQLDWERKRKRVTIARTASTADTISRLAKSIREMTPKSIAKFKVLFARDKSKKKTVSWNATIPAFCQTRWPEAIISSSSFQNARCQRNAN